MDAVVLMDGSEQGELKRKKNHQKGRNMIRLDISLYCLEGKCENRMRKLMVELTSTTISPTSPVQPLFSLALVQYSYQSMVVQVGFHLAHSLFMTLIGTCSRYSNITGLEELKRLNGEGTCLHSALRESSSQTICFSLFWFTCWQ